MTTKIIDGRALAKRIREEAARTVRDEGLDPGLAVILVGEDPASRLYVNLKEKACAEAGIRFERYVYPEGTSQATVTERIETLNAREDIHAILVQLPLPEPLDEDAVIRAIDPKKDVDGFHPETVLPPGLATGILLLAEASGLSMDGKTLAVRANSEVFAEPIEELFAARGVTRAATIDEADFIIVAVGRPGTLTKDDIKEGAAVIDVGTNRLPDGRVVGDAGDLSGKAAAVTPVPGGVGPVTVAMLIRNTVELARRHRNERTA